MEERMYRAQMEVTLFSKAIANLCEELNTKCLPCKPCRFINASCLTLNFFLAPVPLPKYTGYVSACQTPRSDDFEGFRLPTVAHVKCQKWLSTSSEFLVDFPQIQEVPQLYENLLRVSAVHASRDTVP